MRMRAPRDAGFLFDALFALIHQFPLFKHGCVPDNLFGENASLPRVLYWNS